LISDGEISLSKETSEIMSGTLGETNGIRTHWGSFAVIISTRNMGIFRGDPRRL
jgi:hypothetical protein